MAATLQQQQHHHHKPVSGDFTSLALRLALGLLIFFMGFGKALDESGFAAVVATYRLGLPQLLMQAAAYGVTAVELLLGAWLVSGRAPQRAARAALLLNLGYAALLTVSLLRGLEIPNCGCFGVFFAQPLRWHSPLEDLLLIAVSAVLIRRAGR